MKIYVIDASGMTLGRLVNVMTKTLQFTSTHTTGPYTYSATPKWLLLVNNCSKILTKPNKINKKKYYFHSGCPGGLRTLTWKQLRLVNPEKIVELAFHRTLPSTSQARGLTKKVRLYRSTLLWTPKPRAIVV